jgi:hypothetical protein
VNHHDSSITPRPTEDEAAAIAAAIAILRQRAGEAPASSAPPVSRWREVGKREVLRDRTTPSVDDD